AQAVDAVSGVEAVHRPAVVLRVHGEPGVPDVRRRQTGEVERRHGPAVPVGLRVPGWHAEAPGERSEAVVVIERAVLLAVDDHVLDRDATGSYGRGARSGPPKLRTGDPCGNGKAGALEERAPVSWVRPKAWLSAECRPGVVSVSHAASRTSLLLIGRDPGPPACSLRLTFR